MFTFKFLINVFVVVYVVMLTVSAFSSRLATANYLPGVYTTENKEKQEGLLVNTSRDIHRC